MNQPVPQQPTRVISFNSDKNGCGLYRSILPFEYLAAKENYDVSFQYQFNFDLNLIMNSNWIRFQRQCTDSQKNIITEYKKFILQNRGKTKLLYELDDLVHGIEPHNILAYQFYTPKRRQNVVDIMRMCEVVTFSTQFLKDFYHQNFGITQSVVIPNFLAKFLWQPDFSDKRPKKEKPVILLGGSSSHVGGPKSDWAYLTPFVMKTLNEFEWLFVGVCPPELEGKVKKVEWFNIWEYAYGMKQIKADVALAPIADSVFNMAKSDLKYTEYCAMNIPAVCSSIGNGGGPYDLAKCPNLVPAGNSDALYQKIKYILSNESWREETLKIQQEHVSKRWIENPENIQLYKNIYTP